MAAPLFLRCKFGNVASSFTSSSLLHPLPHDAYCSFATLTFFFVSLLHQYFPSQARKNEEVEVKTSKCPTIDVFVFARSCKCWWFCPTRVSCLFIFGGVFFVFLFLLRFLRLDNFIPHVYLLLHIIFCFFFSSLDSPVSTPTSHP